MSEVHDAYHGSDAEKTIAVYKRLEEKGFIGIVAMNLLRACKASEHAKKYRGGNAHGSYKRQAYEKKDWSLMQLTRCLLSYAGMAGIGWGWSRDDQAIGFENVLYIDLPKFGQVSFHNRARHPGPDYSKPWDGVRGLGSSRIIRFACAVLGDPQPAETQGERDVRLKNGSKGGAGARPARKANGAKRAGSGEDQGGLGV